MAIVGRFVSEEEFYKGLGGQDVVLDLQSNEDSLNSALASAEEIAISYLKIRYLMPTTVESTPLRLKQIVIRLSKYHILSDSVNTRVTALDKEDYDGQIDFLDKVRRRDRNSPTVDGLVERDKTSQLRSSTPELDHRQPIQLGRLDGLRPDRDRFQGHGHGHEIWSFPWNHGW